MKILDVCCGGRMFWYNKNEPHTTYMDIRDGDYSVHRNGYEKKVIVHPDIQADFTSIPFDDNTFDMVVFDPPHLTHADGYMGAHYGQLPKDWKPMLKQGFDECMRVLKPESTLIFKWCETHIPFSEVLKVFKRKPIFGDRHSKTRWVVFLSPAKTETIGKEE